MKLAEAVKLAAPLAGTLLLSANLALPASALADQRTPPRAHASETATVLARSVHVRRGIAPIAMTCQSGPCVGTVQLGGSRTPRGLYGSASFSLNTGAQAVVEVRLSSAGRQLLKKGLQVVAWATLSLPGSLSAASRVPLTLSAFTVIANHWHPGFNRFWSGYAVTGQKFSAVRGTFVQPSMTSCTGPRAGSPDSRIANNVDVWSGLDGVGSSPIEQVGTAVVCYILADGTRSIGYYAWYETFPDALIGIPIAIHPGDTIVTEVRAVAPQRFAMTVRDSTTAAAWAQVVHQHTAVHQLSAEWIDEIQGVAPASITTTRWSNVSATARGVTAPVGTPPNAEVTAFATSDVRSHQRIEPSPLSDAGAAFSISWLPGA
jgi:hypothetical protein